jgi:hypothetical protein
MVQKAACVLGSGKDDSTKIKCSASSTCHSNSILHCCVQDEIRFGISHLLICFSFQYIVSICLCTMECGREFKFFFLIGPDIYCYHLPFQVC